MGFGGILRQSTAVDVLIGPFVDSTDGDTEEAALTINRADVLLSKNGQGAVQKTDVTAAASDADGFYNCELDATDTDTVGQLVLYVHVAGALAVRHDFQIVEEEPYDDIFAASAVGYLKPTTAGRDLDVTAGGEAGIDLDNTSGTIAAAQIATDAITAAKIAADAGVEIAQAVWDRVLTGATHNIASSAGRRLRQVEAAFVITSGTAQAGGAASITLASGESATDNIFSGDRVIIVGGTGVGEHGIITAYDGGTKVATMSQNWVIQPASDSEYDLTPADVDVETIENSVTTVDNLKADYDGTGYDKSNSTIGTVTAIATGGVIDGGLAAAELLNIADACLDRRLDLGTDTGGNTTTSRTWRDALRVLRNRADISGGTLTVYEEDDSTTAFTAAISTAAGNPIAQVNPT